MKTYSARDGERAYYVQLDPSTNMVQVEERVSGGSRVVQFPLVLAVGLVTDTVVEKWAQGWALDLPPSVPRGDGTVSRAYHLQVVGNHEIREAAYENRIQELEAQVDVLRDMVKKEAGR